MKKSKTKKSGKPSDLLRSMATLDSCEVRIATDEDQRDGLVPAWCEVLLITDRDGTLQTQYLRRSDAELIIACLDEQLHPNRGGSILHALWGIHDRIMDRLMSKGKKADKLRAQVVGECIAVVTNPYEPDEDHVRELAMERYAARR